MRQIKKIVITAPGDPSVGCFYSSWEITCEDKKTPALDLSVYAEEDVPDVLKELKNQLGELFSSYFAGEPVGVEFVEE